MPFSINKQVQPLQCDKEIILAGTFQGHIIRGDRINKPALVRRKHEDVISFLVIILLYSPKKNSMRHWSFEGWRQLDCVSPCELCC